MGKKPKVAAGVTVVNEILDAFIGYGQNPSDDVLKSMLHNTNETLEQMRKRYVFRYRFITGDSEADPYGPLPMITP